MLVAYNLSTDGIIVVIDNTSAEIAISNEDTFVSTWKTDNAGTSGSTQITLPLEAGGTYDFGINWGDGSSSKITAYDQAEVTHTYPIAGTYKVKIDGVINGWRFNDGGDKAKITDISQWGDLLIGNSTGYFYGCSSLDVSATDVLDVSNVTTLERALQDCTSLTTLDVSNWELNTDEGVSISFNDTFQSCTRLTTLDVSNWGVSSVTTFYKAFYSCGLLDGLDVSNWDVSSVTSFYAAFLNCSNLTTLDVSNWDVSSVTTFKYAFYQCGLLDGLDISGFAIPELTNATEMLTGTTIANYSDVLINWAAQDTIKSNVVFGAGANTYPATTQDSGTTDGTTASKLVQSGQNFNTTVAINDVIHNTTDNTWAVVTAVDSDTTLSIDNDIMISGEAYVIYRSAGVLAKARLIIDYDWIITDGGAE